MNHRLKTWPSYFQATKEGRKTFEIRENDRGFQAGDTATLCEYDQMYGGRYTGYEINVSITYVTGFMQKPGWVVFGTALLSAQEGK